MPMRHSQRNTLITRISKHIDACVKIAFRSSVRDAEYSDIDEYIETARPSRILGGQLLFIAKYSSQRATRAKAQCSTSEMHATVLGSEDSPIGRCIISFIHR
jgi:hypothetical protein